MRKTKILCTLGPASSSAETIHALLEAGMNAVRLNFSHGKHADQAERVRLVREAARDADRMAPIVADLQGPKVRTGKLEGGGPVPLNAGEQLRLTPRELVGDPSIVSIDYHSLALDVKPGDAILLADGAVRLEVRRVDGEDVVCEILNSGELGERKGVNVPGAQLRIPSVTKKDLRDLQFAASLNVDYIAQSFVRTAEDVRRAKQLIAREGSTAHLIAKIEKPQALENLDEILAVADGLMIARGDLGVELSPWQVPVEQKRMIEEAARWRKPVITATQMLESMIHNPLPTRAEASDVANAVFDGTDAVMLSAETAAGDYPVEAVAMMAKIIEAAETRTSGPNLDLGPAPWQQDDFSVGVAHSAARLAESLDAKYIVVYTETGYSAQLISKHHPTCSTLALSPHPDVCHRAKLLWGVRSKIIAEPSNLDALVECVDALLRNLKWANEGDLIVLVAGTPFEVRGRTDLIKLHRIGGG